MRTHNLLVLLVLLSSSNVFAAPSQPSVSGTVSTGSAVTITGSAFGSHSLQIESLQNHIEAATVGTDFSKSGWTLEDWGDYGPTPGYASDSAHSGTKSIKCNMLSENGDCSFAYNMPSVAAGGRFYASWWVKFNGAADGQWKMFRCSYNPTVVDGLGQLNMFNWPGSMQQNVLHPATGYQRSIYYSESPPFYPTTDNTWHRMEVDYRAASTDGTSDGVITVRVTKENGTIYTDSDNDVNTHPTGLPWRYGIFQNFLGNAHTVGTEIWMDDHYIQSGTVARVELCAGSTWATRGKCEVQVPSAWSASSITATLNTGNFANDSTAYLYVIDSAGDASPASAALTVNSSTSNITCHPDADNDLYPGSGSESVETCSSGYYEASHFTAMMADCNDSSASIYPGATETCGDSIDQDCSGSDLACVVTGGTPVGAGLTPVSVGVTPVTAQ